MPGPLRMFLLLNPRSGPWHRRMFQQLTQRKDYYDSDEIDIKTQEIISPSDVPILIKKALEEDFDIIAIAGGDGSVNLAINSLSGQDKPLLIIPQGSGNGFARHLQIPMDPAKAFNLWKSGKISRVDTGKINGQRFASLAGMGFDAHVAKRYNKLRQRGFLSYAYVIIREYFRYKDRTYILELDGKRLQTRALFIVFANGSQFGYNTNIAPEASVSDGYLDVVIFQKIPLRDIPVFLLNILDGRLGKEPFAKVIRAKKVKVMKRRGRTVNIDGEAIRMSEQLDVSIDPQSLNIFTPQ